MNKYLVSASVIATLVLPAMASAHQHATYQIGNGYYQIVIGSLNEPLVVDDKSGIDLTVTKCSDASCMPKMSPDGDMDGPAGTPVEGLDQSLKLTLMAGDKTKNYSLVPQYGKPGSYTAPFYPTLVTTFSYHLTGTINNTPVDLTYTCTPAGTTKAADDKTPKKLSDAVTQTSICGGFGCALEKADLGFPESSSSILDVRNKADGSRQMAVAAIALAAISFVTGAFMPRRRSAN